MDASIWAKVRGMFGGGAGHTVQFMSLPSNVHCDLSGQPPSFLSPYPIPGRAGVNIFA